MKLVPMGILASSSGATDGNHCQRQDGRLDEQ